MATQSEELAELIKELHEINQDFAEAAKPLERLADLNEEARDQLAEQLRARMARWEGITRKIHDLLDPPVDADPALGKLMREGKTTTGGGTGPSDVPQACRR